MQREPFKRERRYVVLKGTDLNVLTEQEQKRLFAIAEMVANGRAAMGKLPLDAFVLEHDWPEFDIVVDMVRRRMEGLPTREDEMKAGHEGTIAGKDLIIEDMAGQLKELRALFAVPEGVFTVDGIKAFYGAIHEREAAVSDWQTKALAIIRNQKEKLTTAQDIAETVFALAEAAPELNRSDIDHDAACQLDAAMIEIHGILKSYLVGGPCATCGGSGSVGGCSGQTPESYQEETYPCPDCAEKTVIASSGRQPGMQTMRDLAMLVKQLSRAIVNHPTRVTEHGRGLADKAMDYLKRKGLQGSPLRVEGNFDPSGPSWVEKAYLQTDEESPWVTEWTARVPRFALVAKADGAYTREAADGEYVKWTDHVSKLQELLKDHGDAALQEIDRLLEVNASLLHTVFQACSYLWGYSNDSDMGTHVKRLLQNCLLARGTEEMKASIKRAITERTPAIIDGEVVEPYSDPLRFCNEQGHPDTAAILEHFQRGRHENATLGAVLACKKANGWDDVEMLAWLANHLLISNNDLQKKLLAEINRRALPAVFPPLSVMERPVTAWSKERPNAAGRWWYWTGDEESAPVLVKVVNAHRHREQGENYLIAIDVPEQMPHEYVGNIEHGYWHPEIMPEVPRG